jgi:cobalt-zinc-cadmium efflux system membrane fusion protein
VTDNAIDGMFPMIAPIGGVIVEKNINPGQEVRPDQMLANDPRFVLPLFVISDPTKLTAILDVTELETSQLTEGETFKVTSPAYPGKVFTGRLEVIGGSIDPVTRTVKARGIVDNSEGLLKAEMFVSIDLETKSNEVVPSAAGTKAKAPATALIELPAKSVFLKSNRHFVFVEESPGTYQRKAVEVESESAGRILAAGPLAAGQRVVVEGGLLLDALTEGEAE